MSNNDESISKFIQIHTCSFLADERIIYRWWLDQDGNYQTKSVRLVGSEDESRIAQLLKGEASLNRSYAKLRRQLIDTQTKLEAKTRRYHRAVEYGNKQKLYIQELKQQLDRYEKPQS